MIRSFVRLNLFVAGLLSFRQLNTIAMKTPRNKTEQKEVNEATKKAKGAEPENATSAKDASKVATKKKKSEK